jgi:hypothetical protein
MGGAIISESGGGIIPLRGGGIIQELGGGFLRNQHQWKYHERGVPVSGDVVELSAAVACSHVASAMRTSGRAAEERRPLRVGKLVVAGQRIASATVRGPTQRTSSSQSLCDW